MVIVDVFTSQSNSGKTGCVSCKILQTMVIFPLTIQSRLGQNIPGVLIGYVDCRLSYRWDATVEEQKETKERTSLLAFNKIHSIDLPEDYLIKQCQQDHLQISSSLFSPPPPQGNPPPLSVPKNCHSPIALFEV